MSRFEVIFHRVRTLGSSHKVKFDGKAIEKFSTQNEAEKRAKEFSKEPTWQQENRAGIDIDFKLSREKSFVVIKLDRNQSSFHQSSPIVPIPIEVAGQTNFVTPIQISGTRDWAAVMINNDVIKQAQNDLSGNDHTMTRLPIFINFWDDTHNASSVCIGGGRHSSSKKFRIDTHNGIHPPTAASFLVPV